MLVTISGAFRNSGDYLIGHRARALLREFVDAEVLDQNRLAIDAESYKNFDAARALILCGGPAYQPLIFPKIYPLDMKRIETKIVPMGLGWKGNLSQTPEDFKFPEPAEKFIREVHDNIKLSSVRDHVTLSILNGMGLKNVSMTGCPAWYDLEFISKDFTYRANPKRIVFSLPAKPQPETFGTLAWLSDRFPNAEKYLALHHGWRPSKSEKGNAMRNWHFQVAAFGAIRGFKTVSIADGLDKMLELYGGADLHVGFRVHAHLLMLSQRRASILIAEDSRGVGQIASLGGEPLLAGGGVEKITDAISAHFDTSGAGVTKSVQVMQQTFPVMKDFLATI
ncbi:MAG: hypothetical protein RLZ28_1041 [Actinomycetota bacterium]|jgi:hypothetical protein